MMHCPHLTHDNRCGVASQMAGSSVKVSAAACHSCQQNLNPQAINVVTIGMALVHRRRRHLPVDDLKRMLQSYLPEQEAPATLKLSTYRPGPGTELRSMLAWFARPSESCRCESRADTMNEWGISGCREHLETILDWLLEEAELRGLPHGRFTRAIARSLVLTAIRRFERKHPDGIPQFDDDVDDEQDR